MDHVIFCLNSYFQNPLIISLMCLIVTLKWIQLNLMRIVWFVSTPFITNQASTIPIIIAKTIVILLIIEDWDHRKKSCKLLVFINSIRLAYWIGWPSKWNVPPVELYCRCCKIKKIIMFFVCLNNFFKISEYWYFSKKSHLIH